MKTLAYYTKQVYGNELIYLADADQAADWYRLTEKKTITRRQMEYLEALTGVKFERVFEPSTVSA